MTALFLDPQQHFDSCPDCAGKRWNCNTCFGTGKVCSSCYNAGIMANGAPCHCGMRNEQRLYIERMTLSRQHFALPPAAGFVSRVDYSKTLVTFAEKNYRVSDTKGYQYQRFVFSNLRAEDFVLWRRAALRIIASKYRSKDLRGFIYINVLEMVNRDYNDFIRQTIMDHPSAVLVYFGVSHLLQPSTYPVIPTITTYLRHPAFVLATQEWATTNAPLINAMHLVINEAGDKI